MEPIYYVICEESVSKPPSYITVWRIIKVVETTMDDLDTIWKREMKPLIENGMNVQGLLFYREPDNPFKEHSVKVGGPAIL